MTRPLSGDGGMNRLRLATEADAAAIDGLMKSSIHGLFPNFYDAAQTRSSEEHVASVDHTLIEDRTSFVIEEPDGVLVAYGGWSRRDKLYTGSGEGPTDARLLDRNTEPALVRAMFVHPDRTRRGLGTHLGSLRDSGALGGFPDPCVDGYIAGTPAV